MEEGKSEKETVWQSIKAEFMKKKVADVGVFTIREKDFLLIKWFKYAVNYTMFGFVMFMTGLVLIIATAAF